MDFRTLLMREGVILFDGDMGTELDKLGLMNRGRNNLDAPDSVVEIHREYAEAGSRVLTTNTLTMNRIYIESHQVGVSVREVNQAGALLARQACKGDMYVLGNLSSTGQLLEPYGDGAESDFFDAFKEQAEILEEFGVDGFIIETIFDLREALCALRACKTGLNLPVIVSMAFATETNGGRTIMGDTADDCAKRLTDAGADAVGANCGNVGPLEMAKLVSLLKSATSLPILAQPNAGMPRLVGDKTVFDMSPQDFAVGINGCVNSGASIVGGCCGTTPQHIRAVADSLGLSRS